MCLERVGDLGDQLPPHAADVRQRREHPDRRGAEGDDAERFDRIAGGAAGEEILRQPAVRLVHALDAADLFDQELERRVDEVLIQTAAADRRRHGDLADLARHAGPEPKHGADEALRQRQKVRLQHFRSGGR